METRSWMSPRLTAGNPAETLRSADLGACLEDYPSAWLYSELNANQIGQLIARRSALVVNQPAGLESQGRILFVLANCDLAMGEGVPASDGIIDDTYFPPWDTWFAVLELDPALEFSVPHILLAWIPEALAVQVQNAIDVAASAHLGWLDELGDNTDNFMKGVVRNYFPKSHLHDVLQIARREFL